MLKCPVCDSKYIENIEKCHTCGWNLRLNSLINTTVSPPSFCLTVESLKEAEAWARKSWHQINQQQQQQAYHNLTQQKLQSQEMETLLVATYNKSPQILSAKIIEVAISDTSINQINEEVVFEISRRGNYWIINLECTTYLVPKSNFKINQFNYNSFTQIFESHGYKSRKISNFILLKPAIVSPISVDNSWKVIDTGIVRFDYCEDTEAFTDI